MHDVQLLRRKLASVRQEVRNLTVMGMRPDLPPEKAELVRNLERSARASAKLRLRHLDYVLKTNIQWRNKVDFMPQLQERQGLDFEKLKGSKVAKFPE